MSASAPHHGGRALRFAPLALVAAMTLTVVGCSDDPVTPPSSSPVSKYSAEVPTAWSDLQMVLVQNGTGFTPPVASRAFGYSGVALYEALVPGMTNHRSLVGQLNEMPAMPQIESGKEYNWPTVANAALARITRSLWANATAAQMATIDSLENALATKVGTGVSTEVTDRSVAHGRAVADAIFEWSKTDGGHEGYKTNFPSSYVVPTGPGFWEPTPRRGKPALTIPLQPYWGQVRPFVLPKGNPNASSEPGAPPAYSTETSSDFYKEANEVYTTVNNLTAEQRTIAEYWADDPGRTCTPPGHSISILSQCIRAKSMSLEFAAESYARLGMAVADAFIACWESKYKYNLVRPITYINRYIDSTWNTPVVTDPVETPPFPEYTSGHSVQSGAMSAVMSALFGSSFAFTDDTHMRDGMNIPARNFTSFKACANEAAISRLYGGIHYRAAIERGVVQGEKIGNQINAVKFKK